MRKIKVNEYISVNEYNKAVYEQAKRYAKQEDISTDCEYMEIFPIVKEIVSREDYKDEAEYYSNIFKISRSNLKREFYEDDREYYQDIYEYFSSLLFYFYYDGCYPGRKDKDTIERYVKEHEKWKISQTLKEGREILELQPFPWEWVSGVTNKLVYDKEKKEWVEDEVLYKKWVTWMIEALEEEGKKAGKL